MSVPTVGCSSFFSNQLARVIFGVRLNNLQKLMFSLTIQAVMKSPDQVPTAAIRAKVEFVMPRNASILQ